MSYTKLIYHIIFSTYRREPTISIENEREMYGAMYRILVHEKAYIYRIGGMPDHVHICMQMPPDKCLSDIVRDLKRKTSRIFADRTIFRNWNGWEEGYGAFTCSPEGIDALKDYIRNQKSHHLTEPFVNEYRRWLMIYGCEDMELRKYMP